MVNITTVKCKRCEGTGKITDLVGIPPNQQEVEIDCPTCNGVGRVESEAEESDPKLDTIISSVNQISEMVKESSEYIKKIYEIVSKGKE